MRGREPRLRVVRHATQADVRVFDVLEAEELAMRVRLEHGLPLTWEAFLTVCGHRTPWVRVRFTAHGADPLSAYLAATSSLVSSPSLELGPRFTADEWSLILAELRDQGAFEPQGP